MEYNRTKRNLLFIILALISTSCNIVDTKKNIPFSKFVVPTVDSSNSRWFFFNSATRPFGMVNLSPDTQIEGAWGSGYRYQTDTVKGFSHIHAWQLSGPSVMPVCSSDQLADDLLIDYYSKFSHESELIEPGYHSLLLNRYGIRAELSSTCRVGFHRYTFPKGEQAAVLFKLGGQLGPSLMKNGNLIQHNDYQFSGQVVNSPTKRRPKDCTVYFSVGFNQKVSLVKKNVRNGSYLIQLTGDAVKPLLMKVAISYTSVENAQINMERELPGWNFDQVVTDSKTEWDEKLSRIEIKGGTLVQQKRFYTDLWHALQGRRIINDINGAYPDYTGESFRIAQLPLNADGILRFNHYNSDAFWGAQWTINTLWGLAYPEIMEEFVHSLMQYFQDGGMIPRGPSGGNYTFVMTGASATPFIVSAIQQGIVKDDLETIYQALKKNHMPGGIMEKAGYEHRTSLGGGLKYYIQNGYVPYPIPEGDFGFHQDGASLTMEYAYQDWALAQLAKKLDCKVDYQYFMKRSENYKNVFDPEMGWMRPKDVKGNWKTDYDPYQLEHGFNESNGAQSTWFVPHDLIGLASLMGGQEPAAQKLNQSFEQAKLMGFTAGTSHDRELHPEYSRIPINYGNQPSIQTAFVFNFLDKPWLTQKWSREVVETVYEGLSPERGYNGDEDQGLMGALAVLMKMGLFSMKGGCSVEPELELGSPIFDEVIIRLNNDYFPGKTFKIKTIGNSKDNRYIQSANFNGSPLRNWHFLQSALVSGGELVLHMTDKPNHEWTAGGE